MSSEHAHAFMPKLEFVQILWPPDVFKQISCDIRLKSAEGQTDINREKDGLPRQNWFVPVDMSKRCDLIAFERGMIVKVRRRGASISDNSR